MLRAYSHFRSHDQISGEPFELDTFQVEESCGFEADPEMIQISVFKDSDTQGSLPGCLDGVRRQGRTADLIQWRARNDAVSSCLSNRTYIIAIQCP